MRLKGLMMHSGILIKMMSLLNSVKAVSKLEFE